MKRLLFVLASVLFSITAYPQETDTLAAGKDAGSEDQVSAPDNPSEKTITLPEGNKKDTIRIKIGKKGFAIIEDEKGTSIKVTEIDEENKSVEEGGQEEEPQEEETPDRKEGRPKFKGHWSGFAFGLNNFVDKDFSMSRTDENRFMDLNTGRSWNFNLNLFEHSFGLVSDKVGLVTGLGIGFNNYHFDGNNSITEDSTGYIVPLYYPDGVILNKTKLATTYLNLPLLLEFQFPGPPSKRLYFSVGVMGGMKICSHTKVIYKLNEKQKDKIRDDFNLSPLRYAYTARIGYKKMQVYGNYYPTPLFEKNHGPELHPIDVGLCLSF